MMKFNCVLLMVILCGVLQLSCGEKIKCEFRNDDYDLVGYLYECKVTSLDNSFDNMTIDGYTGVHMASENDKDVKGIYIHGANLKYIPHGLGSLFNLTGLAIQDSQLVEIRSKDFQGMQNLEYLSLMSNKLTSIPSDTFSMLPKLKIIDLDSNQIKYIGAGVFDQLTNLDSVYLIGNICINKYVYSGATAITQMKNDIVTNCKNEIPTTTTTTTTTQNPLELELKALKNEAKDQQQMNQNELNKLKDYLQKEQLENIKIRRDKDALKKDKNNLMKDRESLKIELKNKFTEINELKEKFERNCKQPIETIGAVDVKLNEIMNHLMKESKDHQMECNEIIKLRAELSLTKDLLKAAKDQQKKDLSEEEETMKKTIIDLNTELIEVKSQRQLERTTYRQLRSKLMEAKEQLAECQINERGLI